jgi:hypothetical protein
MTTAASHRECGWKRPSRVSRLTLCQTHMRGETSTSIAPYERTEQTRADTSRPALPLMVLGTVGGRNVLLARRVWPVNLQGPNLSECLRQRRAGSVSWLLKMHR